MVSLNSIFEIGARALFAQQSAINTTGHNIANANTEGFSRQRVRLETSTPLDFVPGQFGTGVQAVAVERIRDEFIDNQIRTQATSNGFFSSQREIMDRLEVVFSDPLNPVSDSLTSTAQSGLNSSLSSLFDAWQELSLNPESAAIRSNLREQAMTATEAFNLVERELTQLGEDVNETIGNKIDDINSLAAQIADLNQNIAVGELGEAQNANDLRDKRDGLVLQLSRIIKINVEEEPSGSVTIKAFGVSLVEKDQIKELAVEERDDGTGYFDILFDTIRSRSLTADIDSGELGGLLRQRDAIIPEFQEQTNELAGELIAEVNRIHSSAMGLEGFTTMTGTRAVSNSTVPLNAAGLAFPSQAGSFDIRLLDSNGDEVNVFTIDVDPNGTPGAPPPAVNLDELVAQIDAVDGTAGGGPLSAQVVNNQLQISTASGFQFAFSNDNSGVLTSLGMNEFFSGSDASDIRVSDQVLNNVAHISTGVRGEPGDNSIALAIAQLSDARTMENDTVTFNDFYRGMTASLGVQSRRIQQLEGTTESLVQSLQQRQDQVTGTSVDEEAINLIRFQRAYTAAARLVTSVDELFELVVTRLGLVGR